MSRQVTDRLGGALGKLLGVEAVMEAMDRSYMTETENARLVNAFDVLHVMVKEVCRELDHIHAASLAETVAEDDAEKN